jgi:hypothetical protein
LEVPRSYIRIVLVGEQNAHVQRFAFMMSVKKVTYFIDNKLAADHTEMFAIEVSVRDTRTQQKCENKFIVAPVT